MNTIGHIIRFIALIIVTIFVLTHLKTPGFHYMLSYAICIFLFFLIINFLCIDTCNIIVRNIGSSVCGNNIDNNSVSSYRTQVADTVVSITRNGQFILKIRLVTAKTSTEQNKLWFNQVLQLLKSIKNQMKDHLLMNSASKNEAEGLKLVTFRD